MTVIVWDGKTLAADRMATTGYVTRPVSKILKTDRGWAAFAGREDQIAELLQWINGGKKPEDWPSFQASEDWTRVVTLEAGVLEVYEKRPYPIPRLPVGWQKHAWGSGAECAIGALWAGADAVTAVKICNDFIGGCGFGVDSVEAVE